MLYHTEALVAVVLAGALPAPPAARLVPAVDRAVRILDVLRHEPRSRGISDLARELGLNKATVREILLTLEHHGLVERDVATTRFRLGYGLYAYAGALGQGNDLIAAARPFLRALVERTGETALLGLLDGERILIVDTEEPPSALKISAPIGRRLPLYAGSFGKVLLAALEPARLARLLAERPPVAHTPRTIVEPAAYREMLRVVRRQGYAVDDEEYLDGVRAATAPVRGADGATRAALTVVGFSTRMNREQLALAVEAVVDAAEQVSRRLGAVPALAVRGAASARSAATRVGAGVVGGRDLAGSVQRVVRRARPQHMTGSVQRVVRRARPEKE